MAKEFEKRTVVVSTIPIATEELFFDDFENTLVWNAAIDTPGGYIGRTTERRVSGNHSLKITDGSGSKSVFDINSAYYTINRKRSNLMFWSFWINTVNLSAAGTYLILRLWVEKGTDEPAKEFTIRFEGSSGNWAYLNSSGTYTALPALPSGIFGNAWIFFQLGIDVENQKYQTVKVGPTLQSLADIDGYTIISGWYDQVDMFIELEARVVATQNTIYIDDVIIKFTE